MKRAMLFVFITIAIALLNSLYFIATVWGIISKSGEVTLTSDLFILFIITLLGLIAFIPFALLLPSKVDWTAKKVQLPMTAGITMCWQLGSSAISAYLDYFHSLMDLLHPKRFFSAITRVVNSSPALSFSFYMNQTLCEEAIFTGFTFFGLYYLFRLRFSQLVSLFLAAVLTSWLFSGYHGWAYLGKPIGEALFCFFRYWRPFFSTFTTQMVKCVLAKKDDSILGTWFGHLGGNFIASGSWLV